MLPLTQARWVESQGFVMQCLISPFHEHRLCQEVARDERIFISVPTNHTSMYTRCCLRDIHVSQEVCAGNANNRLHAPSPTDASRRSHHRATRTSFGKGKHGYSSWAFGLSTGDRPRARNKSFWKQAGWIVLCCQPGKTAARAARPTSNALARDALVDSETGLPQCNKKKESSSVGR